MSKHIFIAADHGGFELKGKLKNYLESGGFSIDDLGATEFDPNDDYPAYAFGLAEQVASTENSLGILICRSGIGMSIAANKVEGAYAALCFSSAHAVKAREHNDANILVLDADYHDQETVTDIVDSFIDTEFAGERHERRVMQIKNYELKQSGEPI